MLLSRETYSNYRDIPPEASRVKCLAQGHNVIWLGQESNWRPSDYQPDSFTVQPPDSLHTLAVLQMRGFLYVLCMRSCWITLVRDFICLLLHCTVYHMVTETFIVAYCLVADMRSPGKHRASVDSDDLNTFSASGPLFAVPHALFVCHFEKNCFLKDSNVT